jgi:hypothetical protein
MDYVQKDECTKRTSFYQSICKLAAAGERAGLIIEDMIELLNAGLRVEQLLDLIASRLRAQSAQPALPSPPLRKAPRLHLN